MGRGIDNVGIGRGEERNGRVSAPHPCNAEKKKNAAKNYSLRVVTREI
jgi:hypothetical protein